MKNWPEPSLSSFCQFLLTFYQFLLTFHLGLKYVSRTTYLNSRNNYNQISQELVSVRDMAEDTEVGSRTSSTTRSAKNSSVSRTWLMMLKLVVMINVLIMKRLKNYLFPRSQTYLQSILFPYALTLIAYFLEKNKLI